MERDDVAEPYWQRMAVNEGTTCTKVGKFPKERGSAEVAEFDWRKHAANEGTICTKGISADDGPRGSKDIPGAEGAINTKPHQQTKDIQYLGEKI